MEILDNYMFKITELLCMLSLVDCDFLVLSYLKKNNSQEHFFSVYIASSKHSGGWENFHKLCGPEM